MGDEKNLHLYDAVEDAPIPTYEEATSSRTFSRRGPQEVSDDAERQGLLGNDLATDSGSRRRNGYYQQPSVQSVSDEDDNSDLDSLVRDSEEGDSRQIMEEMEILDPESAESGGARRNRLRGRFSKRFYSITDTLSSFHLPKLRWPSISFEWLTSRLPSIPEEYRPGWAILARLFGLVVIISLVYLLVVSEIMPMGGGGFGQPFNPEWVRQQVQQNVDPWRIQENLQYITSYDHVGGSEGSFFLGQWIEGKFQESHMDTFTHEEFYVYMNFPKKGGRRVAIVEPTELAWEAKLQEGSAYNPPKSQTDSFHGLSASGNVTGPLVYVNYGHEQDFKTLKDKGVDVKGTIALIRYYGTQSDPATKVKAAQDAGVAGVLLYSDPADDGFVQGKVWPHGRWRPEDGVQRGSVALTNWIAGDPLTPGQPSTKEAKRMSKDKNPALPTIPSLPLSWSDAQKLLQSLKEVGEEVPADWRGAVPDVGDQWFSGHPDRSPKVNLQNFQDEVEQQLIQNVFGSFIGIEDKAKKIIIGNHRDSWCFGAADPGSGTAVMLEVARVLGELRAQGWRPLRTIEFASWDAEEYNLMGSTEHVEANLENLRKDAIAYINVDVGVTGEKLWANGSPIFRQAWERVLDRLEDPRQNKTLRELWDADNRSLGNLGADGDYLAFQDIAGCSSIDFGFAGPDHGNMHHSCYETFDWVSKYIDPGFAYHNLLAQMWALLILELAQEPILPLKLTHYTGALQNEANELVDWSKKHASDFKRENFQPLFDVIASSTDQAKTFHDWEDFWYGQVYGTGGFESPSLTVSRMAHNNKMAGLETSLLDVPRDMKDKSAHGLPGRDQFRHVIFGPDVSDSGQKGSVFPFIRDALLKKDWELAKKQVQKTAALVKHAFEHINHAQ
ncbi:N-acetylated-alpha-linked acidic dipeptidase 2 [Aaosphaeria arxii CBS 175.79]|uniref:N-acetylated-alpha-linked acidic dipeptidase 2 n=1 Tax=Aaosphaeria arxii CBS 175.79 TaxID=1450172 RepID=A0A6A5XTA3_9PLEO|nr:N-acetylated-alpha-linked acidic dipeptidase 2 [Aaosphaeria arxii CBS 175.79]KAF2016156.1 N-acetylated-alpha-linked acidic dipeptidase 2 [Aaosphaeria arxii CBS 175.79]